MAAPVEIGDAEENEGTRKFAGGYTIGTHQKKPPSIAAAVTNGSNGNGHGTTHKADAAEDADPEASLRSLLSNYKDVDVSELLRVALEHGAAEARQAAGDGCE